MKTKRKTILIALGVAAAAAVGGVAIAQSTHSPMQPMSPGMHGSMHAQMHGGGTHGGGHGPGHGQSGPAGDQSASSLAFAAVNEKMHRDMAISYSGNADADFVRGMIPHHQGAVDMAKIVIAFGKDPEIRKLAEEIVKAQETEIAFMQAWLKKQGPVSRN